MRDWRLLLVGFGTVGRGLVARLQQAAPELERIGMRPRLVGVVDPACGSRARSDGFDPAELLACVEGGGRLGSHLGGEALVEDPVAAIHDVPSDVVLEMTPTDLSTGGAGLVHVRAALDSGRHVATTNKGPVALAWPELASLARERRVQLRCEGTVMSGTPVLSLFEHGLRGAGVTAIRGVLNGTCNFMLGRMEEGDDWDTALAEAQRRGYAETDPAGDVEGFDAAAKVAILANLLLDAGATLADVERRGIRDLDPGRVRDAATRGLRYKLVGEIVPAGRGWSLRVAPRQLGIDDPLARVTGADNLLAFETRALGTVSIQGPGAGREATGHALVSDLIAIHRSVAGGF